MNLRRISFAYAINVKYDCLAFREDMLLTHSRMIDLFQSKNNSLKSRISVTPTFQRLRISNKNIARFSWPFVGH